MERILFVCHGNICRSAMAECIFKHRISMLGLADQYETDSAATSSEEIGNPIYPPARRKLEKMGIPVQDHRARRITSHDMEYFDRIIYMDKNNLRNLRIMFKENLDKLYPMLDERDVADPWYTGNFDQTYADLDLGITRLLSTRYTSD